jgi:rare lipoprotein A (peptidoglycan hydrolase)
LVQNRHGSLPSLLSRLLLILLPVTIIFPQDSAASVGSDTGSSAHRLEAREVRGQASWYDDGPGFYAAAPSFKWGDTPYRVVVFYKGRSVIVIVRDHCQCYVGTSKERVIDLSPEAFSELAPLSVGVLKNVRYTTSIQLPETDMEGSWVWTPKETFARLRYKLL